MPCPFKHSKEFISIQTYGSLRKTQMSTRVPCSVHTYRANVNLSEQLSKKKNLDVHITIRCMFLKVIAPKLLAVIGVLYVTPIN